VLGEMAELTARHRIKHFSAADNILPYRYVSELFPEMQRSGLGYRLFYMTKANFTKDQLCTLYAGGLRWIQPGIESLSSHVLGLMRKGCTMLQNVLTLKWCHALGMQVAWNLLYGFPGETAGDYADQLTVLRSIPHLPPPDQCLRIRLHRHSPYFEGARDRAGDIRPKASYQYVYPGGLDLFALARSFDGELDGTLPETAHAETRAWVQQWRERWDSGRRPALLYRRTGSGILIEDYRDAGTARRYSLSGTPARVYEYRRDPVGAASARGGWRRFLRGDGNADSVLRPRTDAPRELALPKPGDSGGLRWVS